jgi:lipoate-protein ligase A
LPAPGASGASSPFFDVERFRSEPRRLAVVQAAARPTLVLGSTQRPGVVSDAAAGAAGVVVERRRGGGGAVLLQPGDHLWLDAWIPRADPLWLMDVAVAAGWVGSWWSAALREVGVVHELHVHSGKSEPGPLGDLVCFAGRGPGEVFAGERKLVGLSQWRAREGALFSSCVYTRWAPAGLADLLVAGEAEGGAEDRGGGVGLVDALGGVAVGLADVLPGSSDGLTSLRDSLLRSFALLA